MDSRDISSDLSSQQLLVNQLKERLHKNESLLKGRESEFNELQSKFNKLKFLHKSKTTSGSESSPIKRDSISDEKITTSSDMSSSLTTESVNRGKYLLLKKQLDESRGLLQQRDNENQLMRRELQTLKDKQIKYEEENDDKDVEVITVNESTSGEGVNEMFAQIVYKDTKIMEMNQKICDLETFVMDLQENLKEQNEVLQARNRAIKVLLSQQQPTGALNVSFDEVVQREEEKERIEKLKERVCELEMEKGNLQLRLMEVEGTNGSKPPVIDIELERDSLRAERDELKIRFNELMAKYDSLDLQKDKVVKDRERVFSEVKKIKDINNSLNEEKDRFKTTIDEMNHNFEVNQQIFNSVNNELISLKTEISGKDSEIQAVRQQLSDLAIKSKNMIADKDSLIHELQEVLEQKSEDIPNEKDKQIVVMTEELEKSKKENLSLVNINEELKTQCNELIEKLGSIEDKLELQKSNYNQIVIQKEDIESQKMNFIEALNEDIQRLQNETIDLKEQLDNSTSLVSQLELRLSEISADNERQCLQMNTEIENLKKINSDLESNHMKRVTHLEHSMDSLNEEMSALLSEKSVLIEKSENLKILLETEKQQNMETIEMLNKIENSKHIENDLIEEKDKTIDKLREELKNYEKIINEENTKTIYLMREQEESKSFIKELETVFEEKSKAFDVLDNNYSENKLLLNNKIEIIVEMCEQKQELESRLEEAKVKNQSLAKQMENLIKVIEIESQEKEMLKKSLENLQKENFEENDLIREKDQRIENLQKEIRKQVEDMQEIEELLTEKQNEIQVLNNNIIGVQKERTDLMNQNEEMAKRFESIGSQNNDEITTLLRQIEDLNEENDSNKSEIKALNQKLSDELRSAKELFDSKEGQNLLTIEEMRKELENKEMKLNEAMNELMAKSDANIDKNLLNNEIKCLNETIASLQQQNQLLENDFHTSVTQLNTSVNEYKSHLDESRNQIDRLEAEKLSAIQETNKVNQVLENERENQTIVLNENQDLRQRLTQLEFDLQNISSQNHYEYEGIQNDRINDLNQTIDDLKKHNSELNTNLEQMKHFLNEIENSSAKQLQELQQKAENERLLTNQQIIDLQNTVESLSSDKQRFEFGFYELQTKCQELDLLLQNKNIETENLRQNEDTIQKLTKSLSSLKEENEHNLSALSEKEKLIELLNEEKLQLISDKQLIQQSFGSNESNSDINPQIQSLTEMNANLQKNCNTFVEIETELKTKIAELEQQLQEYVKIQTENEAKSSETEYELDILKRNYSLELESFGAQVQERESLIEKLQTINEKMKRKYEKYEKMIKEFTEKECYYKSKLDESQGLIKYEQMQRQTATDSRIFELQQQLSEKDIMFQKEMMSLKTNNSNLIALEQELRRKIKELEENTGKSRDISAAKDSEQEMIYRSRLESLTNQLESERNEKRRLQEMFQSNGDQNSDQLNQLLAQMETERQTQLAQKHELELKCKRFAAKFKVKEREVNSLEEKLKVIKENASKNVNEEELIESNKRNEELTKRVEDLQSMASNLDSALQTERQKRRQLEDEKQTFWSQPKAIDSESPIHSSSFSLLIDEGNGDKIGVNSAKRFISKQKHYLLRGPPNAKYKRIAILVYLVVIHVFLIKGCLF